MTDPQALIRSGNLYLSAQDVIALVLENNLDIAVQRYSPLLAREVVRVDSAARHLMPRRGIAYAEAGRSAGNPGLRGGGRRVMQFGLRFQF